jgi:hypothetical protein
LEWLVRDARGAATVFVAARCGDIKSGRVSLLVPVVIVLGCPARRAASEPSDADALDDGLPRMRKAPRRCGGRILKRCAAVYKRKVSGRQDLTAEVKTG